MKEKFHRFCLHSYEVLAPPPPSCLFTLNFYVFLFTLYDHFYGKTSPHAYFTHDLPWPPLREQELARGEKLALPLRLPGGLAEFHGAACQNVDAKCTNVSLRSDFKRKTCLGPGRSDEVAWTCRCTQLLSDQETNDPDKNVEYFLALDVVNLTL